MGRASLFYHEADEERSDVSRIRRSSVAVNASAMYNIPIPNIETDI